jgi:hypothetical protein
MIEPSPVEHAGVRAARSRSLRRTALTALAVAVTVVIVVLLGFGAVRSFRSAKAASVASAVATPQLIAALDHFVVDNPDRVFVRYDDLFGPTAYVKGTNAVDGEDYHALFPMRTNVEMVAVTVSNGDRVIMLHGLWGRVVVTPDGEISGPPDLVRQYVTLAAELGARHGVVITRLPNGRRFESTWDHGIEHGPFRAYHANDRLWAEARYVRGKPVGHHVLYDENGRVLLNTVFPDVAVAVPRASRRPR